MAIIINKLIKTLSVLGLSLFGLNACVASNSSFENGSSYGTYHPKPASNRGVFVEKWFLTKINNAPYQGKRITLNLSSDKKVNGFSGCNNYFSSNVQVSGNHIKFGTVGSTRKLCIDKAANRLENKYLDILSNVVEFERSTSRLELMGRKGTLTFYKRSRR